MANDPVAQHMALMLAGEDLGTSQGRSAVENEPRWQPIETAPKDGTVVLICGHGSRGYFVADAKWGGEWLMFHPDGDDYFTPCFAATHWMPLPAPPASQETPDAA